MSDKRTDAELERFRAALQEIASGKVWETLAEIELPRRASRRYMMRRAREALRCRRAEDLVG